MTKRTTQIKRPGYHAHYSVDDNGLWFVKVTDLQGAHSHGRTIVAARKNVREAIAVVLDIDDENGFDLTESFHIPNREELDTVLALRSRAQTIATDADLATRDYVTRSNLSVRDLSELVGLSFQRIHQIRQSEPA
jgi:predicted RNase H-like HicB family nuclease